jgi:UDP-N-acetylmuramoylalanine--D-glutamate ligase
LNTSAKNIVIIGAGESGVGAALLAKNKGYNVFVSDKNQIKSSFKQELINAQIPFEENEHSINKILNATEIIKSPGIPHKAPIIQEALKKNISVISDIEFGARFTNAQLIGITGTNGKTTTTLLTYHILKKASFNVGLGGNVGKSFCRIINDEPERDYYVLEISSFMLDDMYKTKFHVAVLTNITPDHLDRYNYQYEKYIESKFRITQNQTEHDFFIYCADSTDISQNLSLIKGTPQLLPFSIQQKLTHGAWIEDEQIIINNHKNQITMPLNNLALVGKHNLYNSMAAAIAAKVLNIRKDVVRESLSDFENIEHRLEFVARVHGIDFINDSKATNVNSTWYALESMTRPVIWIVGGTDKGNDYEMLMDLVKEKVKAIVCLGVDNSKIIKAFSHLNKPMTEAKSAEEAVLKAYKFGKTDDVVLLSPACASFDLFENYEDRGNKFKLAVRSL